MNREAFEQRIAFEPNTGCHIWTGAVQTYPPGHRRHGKHGYGVVWTGSGYRGAHRYAWQLDRGAIPRGMNVLHTCDTPECVNVAHLRLGTQSDNMRDAYEKGRLVGRFARR